MVGDCLIHVHHRLAPVVTLASLLGCGASPAVPPANNSVARAPEPRTSPGCTLVAANEPLSREELELKAAPEPVEEARALLVGTWDGYHFMLDNELGHSSAPPRPDGFITGCFASGRVTLPHEATKPGCGPRTRTYTLVREPDGGNALTLYVERRGGCPNDAGFHQPYRSPYYVHRLDDKVLVLIDGVTGGVTGYRRR